VYAVEHRKLNIEAIDRSPFSQTNHVKQCRIMEVKVMRKVVILITEVVLPIAVAIVLAAVFRTVYVSEDGCNFLWLWIVVGFPFGITRIRHILVPLKHDLASTVGIWLLNVMIAGFIGGVVLVWRVVRGMIRCLIA
jgi:hypothetical protein